MSIEDRIADARLLWDHGRREGALLSALVAVAAASRQRFPRSAGYSDRQAFTQLLSDALPWNIAVEYRGKLVPVEELFYEWFRCQLVHEGRLPQDIQFLDDVEPEALVIRAGGAPEYVLKVSPGWLATLARAATDRPL